jgi:YggT family protein
MEPVETLLTSVISLFIWVVIIEAVLSWLVAFDVVNTRNKFVGTIGDICHRISTPVLAPIRKFVPPLGGVDLSPIVLIIGLNFISNLIVKFINF